MEIVHIDRSGRLVIPELIRKKLHLSKDVPLMITEIDDNKILIKKLEWDDIEKRPRGELGGIDIDNVAGEVRAEVNEEAKRRYKSILD
ncbi:MAG TPA: hypothetical protein VMW53_00280 [archaeon]|nr:hypothetical protein [archaeon]